MSKGTERIEWVASVTVGYKSARKVSSDSLGLVFFFYGTSHVHNGRHLLSTFQLEHEVKVSVYPKFDHFSDRSYCNLSFKKNSLKKD